MRDVCCLLFWAFFLRGWKGEWKGEGSVDLSEDEGVNECHGADFHVFKVVSGSIEGRKGHGRSVAVGKGGGAASAGTLLRCVCDEARLRY